MHKGMFSACAFFSNSAQSAWPGSTYMFCVDYWFSFQSRGLSPFTVNFYHAFYDNTWQVTISIDRTLYRLASQRVGTKFFFIVFNYWNLPSPHLDDTHSLFLSSVKRKSSMPVTGTTKGGKLFTLLSTFSLISTKPRTPSSSSGTVSWGKTLSS